MTKTVIRPKDYVSVAEQLYFAVVSDVIEQQRVLTFLRYIRDAEGMHKLGTEQADAWIKQQAPEFLYHSELADIELHGIPLDRISEVISPRHAVEHLLKLQQPDAIQCDALHVLRLLLNAGIEQQRLGVTGSIMLGAHSLESDIDLVVYGRDAFFQAREVIKQCLHSGSLQALDDLAWQDAYRRRGCSLDFQEYLQHELRKLNKCVSGSSKVDLTMIPDPDEQISRTVSYKKCQPETITALVRDDRYAYDFPASYAIDHDLINEVVVFTGTYIGQAIAGETIEASGIVEQDESGNRRLVVGTSREAVGEYLRVIE